MRGFGPCWMTPATMSPSLPRNSPSTASSAMSRRRWLMTCLAAKAAMRPKSSGVVSSSPMTAPSSSMSGHEDRDVAGLAVEDGAGALGQLARGGGVLGVGGQDRLLDDAHELVEGDLLLALNRPQAVTDRCPQVTSLFSCRRRASGARHPSTVPDAAPAVWENSGRPADASADGSRAVRDDGVVAVEPRLRPAHQRRQERRGRDDQRPMVAALIRHPPHVRRRSRRGRRRSAAAARAGSPRPAPTTPISSGRLPRSALRRSARGAARAARRSGSPDRAAGRPRRRAT